VKKASFNEGHKEILDSFLLKIPQVKAGKMFGYPAYFVHGKLFACVYGQGVGIKIPEDLAHVLLVRRKKSVKPFQPMGKPKMREWIEIDRRESQGYLRDKDIFLSSIQFVSSIAAKR
jgi:hypothetical protein